MSKTFLKKILLLDYDSIKDHHIQCHINGLKKKIGLQNNNNRCCFFLMFFILFDIIIFMIIGILSVDIQSAYSLETLA